MTLKVQDQSPEVVKMAKNWPIVTALLGGTPGMRAAGMLYLPKQPAEAQEDYDYRLKVATLFPAFERTLSVMAGKPFSKELTLGEDVPPKIAEWCKNSDQHGKSLHAFASGLFAEAMSYGLCGVLVDYPTAGADIKTLADERRLNLRPYLVLVKHDQILGWKSEVRGSEVVLTQLRIQEFAKVDDGEFGTKCVRRVRVLEPGAWAVYEEIENGQFFVHSSGVTSLKKITFVPFYGRQLDFMNGVSPLLNLAYLNVEHWQESSDQKDSTRYARKRMLVLIGADATEGADIVAGSNMAMKMPQGSDAKVVQGSSESVTVGRSEIAVLEQQMIQAGAELLVQKPGQKTATEDNNDAEASKCDLQRMVESFEDGLDQVLQFMAEWVGEAEGGHAQLFKDFGAASLTDASAQLVVTMQQAGLISKPTAIREQQRRGMLSSDIDPDLELAAVQDEGPPLGTMNDPGNGGSGQ